MTTYRAGQMVVVNVPFSNQAAYKPRPALVISIDRFHRKLPDMIVCPVSSQPRFFSKPGPGDIPLLDWRKMGLRYPSSARISKILAVEKKIIKRVLGPLSQRDFNRVKDALRQALGL